MKEIALEILKRIYDYGYEAYIVGGFVRDTLLGINSKDVDITTNATPMELKNIWPSIESENTNYGSTTLYYKNCRFELTTYRKDLEYLDNRHPSSIVYVNDLKTDLLRRDFTINTLCIDKDGNLIDLLDGQKDLEKREINTIGDSLTSFQNDALRILRALRFATTLNFNLSEEILSAINKTKHLLKNISYDRKKRELDRIFACSRAKEGILLIKDLGLVELLELSNIERVQDYSDLIGIWSMINTSSYPFSNSEKELIKKVNLVYEKDNLNNHILYQYGLYVNILAGINKGINKKLISRKYGELPIKTRDDILISAQEICEILKKKPGPFISEIYKDLERKILDGLLINERVELENYIRRIYGFI